MTVISAVLRSLRLVLLCAVSVVAIAACSSDETAAEATDDAVASTKDAMVSGEETEQAQAPDVTMPPADATEMIVDDDAPPTTGNPPGTVNDLDDLIGNESDDGLGVVGDDPLVERFIVVLLDDTDSLEVSEAEARCAGELLEQRLSPTSFELLVTNLETTDEIGEGTQFTDAELLVISESLANCIDFRSLVDEIVGDQAELGALVECLAREVGVDGVEALVLVEVIGEDIDRLSTPLFLEGLDSCPVEARAAIDATILQQFLLADAPAIEACLAQIGNAELRPFFDTVEFSELIVVLRDQCLF